MEGMFTSAWFAALGGIILLDLILSGDNAILIALAVKNLPEHEKRKGILIGGLGAVGIRIICTLFATALLAIPYLEFIGGIALLFIALHLLAPEQKEENGQSQPTTLLAAVRTVLVADFIMSIDNILSLAGMANAAPDGKWSLIIIGLAISIAIVLGGAEFFLLVMKKIPALIYLGAALIAYTAAELMVKDAAIGVHLHDYALILKVSFVAFVVLIGYFRRRSSNKGDKL